MAQTIDSWVVQFVNARDYFDQLSEAYDWLEIVRPDRKDVAETMDWDSYLSRVSSYLSALKAAQQSGNWSGDLRQPPVVGYDPVNDEEFFMFKQENNGDTFVVSRHGFSGLKSEEIS
jgi:hypothetical protein